MAETLDPAPSTPLDPFPAGAHPLDWRRSGLNAFARGVCRSFLEAALADEDDRGALVPPSDATLDRVIHKLDMWLGSGSRQLQIGFLALVAALETLPLAIIRKPSRMTKLGLADRLHYLEKLEDSPNGMLTMLLVAFKVPMLSAAYEEGELMRDTGFERESLTAVRTNLRRPAPQDGGRS